MKYRFVCGNNPHAKTICIEAESRDMTHNEVKRVVAYAVSKGYETERDIPSDELAELLEK